MNDEIKKNESLNQEIEVLKERIQNNNTNHEKSVVEMRGELSLYQEKVEFLKEEKYVKSSALINIDTWLSVFICVVCVVCVTTQQKTTRNTKKMK